MLASQSHRFSWDRWFDVDDLAVEAELDDQLQSETFNIITSQNIYGRLQKIPGREPGLIKKFCWSFLFIPCFSKKFFTNFTSDLFSHFKGLISWSVSITQWKKLWQITQRSEVQFPVRMQEKNQPLHICFCAWCFCIGLGSEQENIQHLKWTQLINRINQYKINEFW